MMASNYYQYPYYQQQQPHRSGIAPQYKAAGAVAVSLAVIVLLVRLLRSLKEAQEADRGDRRRAAPPSSDGGGSTRQPPAPAEMVRSSVGPLVCTYRRADGWREAACAVCLAELADGEAVRLLPACMHYFHAECVGEWLRAHQTCPLCRAPTLHPAASV